MARSRQTHNLLVGTGLVALLGALGTGQAVLELLLAMNREQGTTMVMVTHE